MKINIAYPLTGCQKQYEVNDEKKLKILMDKRLGQLIDLDFVGDEFKGVVGKITGGCDKQGFPMMQGILTNQRVRLLLKEGSVGYQSCLRKGMRKRKSIRGCIIDPHVLSVIYVIIVKAETEIDGLTNKTIPRALGPKRANKIRKMFNLSKSDDVRQYVVRKTNKKGKSTAPKIQRLITPQRLQRKRRLFAIKKARAEKSAEAKAEYLRLLAKRNKEKREAKRSSRRSSTRLSGTSA